VTTESKLPYYDKFTYPRIKVEGGERDLQTPQPVSFKSLMDIGLSHSIVLQQVNYNLVKQMEVQAILDRLETARRVITTWGPVN
jgi:hypothetical protein